MPLCVGQLKKYRYDEVPIGKKESFCVEITEDKQNVFRNMSGDINPLHINKEFAQRLGFDDRLVFGMLTSSFYSTLVGTYLPGEGCLLREIDIKFRKPVFIGDVLRITGECSEKNDTFMLLTIKAKIYNQNNDIVSSAKIIVGFLNE